jgi:hypothetical protein
LPSFRPDLVDFPKTLDPDKNNPLPSRKCLAAKFRKETGYTLFNRAGSIWVFGIASGGVAAAGTGSPSLV